MVQIHGTAVDPQGRCAHYRSPRDVIANKCATCGKWWACFQCHREHAGHPFGRMLIDAAGGVPAPQAAACGACGHTMAYAEYSIAGECAGCGHPFNPGCAMHAPLYFQV